VDVGCPGTPGSDEILATVNVAAEYVDIGSWVGLWDANERYESIPRSDTTIEVVVLPGLTMMGEGLKKHSQQGAREQK